MWEGERVEEGDREEGGRERGRGGRGGKRRERRGREGEGRDRGREMCESYNLAKGQRLVTPTRKFESFGHKIGSKSEDEPYDKLQRVDLTKVHKLQKLYEGSGHNHMISTW